jgi:D-sedoheptulose 7-phosphate isomerase
MTRDSSGEDRPDAGTVLRTHLDGAAAALQRATLLADAVEGLATACLETLGRGGRIAWCGNGGSAAEAQHLATELVVRFRRERRALASLALSADGVVLTATGNDYGFEQVFARQVEALLQPGDLLIHLSTSGRSPDLIAAARAARQRGVQTWALLGPGPSPLAGEVDQAIAVDAPDAAHVQEVHLALGHVLCELIDRGVAEWEREGTR